MALSARWLARGVAGLHYAFLAYLLGGGVLARRYPRSLPVHAAVAAWGVVVATSPLPCPLTVWQNRLRVRAGLEPLPVSFLASYVEGRCYPHERERHVQAVAAAGVLLSWADLARRRRSARVSEAS